MWFICGLVLGIILSFGVCFVIIRKNKYKNRIDGLTKLFDYQYFSERFRDAFLRARRNKTLLTLVLLDIDNFKSINENYGYKTGDIVIHFFATFLKNNLRETDLVFRYKLGDEFAIILQGNNSEEANKMCQRLRMILKTEPISGLEPRLDIGFSCGINSLEDYDCEIDDFIEETESLLRLDKTY